MRDYSSLYVRGDLSAGLTVGAMLVPQAMAYALLAGLPPEVGLYASMAPLAVYALLGTSRQLAVGPVAIVSLMSASALAGVAQEGTSGYVAAAALLAALVGLVHIVFGLARLGRLVNRLSHPALVGFTAAAALIIGVSQVKHLFGVDIARRDYVYQTLGDLTAALGDANTATMILAGIALATLFVLKRVAPRVPGSLVVVVGSIVAVAVFDLEAQGVAVVGDIPSALPAFALPSVSSDLLGPLAGTAVVITLVGFMESMAVAKVYARRHRYEIDPNRELVGLGAANVASGLFGGYPVTGGFSRTAVNDAAGARTPLASLITAAIVLVTATLFTPVLATLPKATLGAIIIVAVVGLVDPAEVAAIARRRGQLLAFLTVFLVTLGVGIEWGIVAAVVVSLIGPRDTHPDDGADDHVDDRAQTDPAQNDHDGTTTTGAMP